MHAVNGIKLPKYGSALRQARGLIVASQTWIITRRLRRTHLLALIAFIFLGVVTSAYLAGRSLGKEQAQAALGRRLADAATDPLSVLLARSPGARGNVDHLTKVEPLERVSDVTHAHHPDSGFFPAGYYGLGDDLLASEPDGISSDLAAPKGDGDDFTGFGPPPFSSDEPGDIFVPGGGSSGGGGGGGGGGASIPTSPVPEPATWVSLIVGFLCVGIAARQRRVRKTAQLAETGV
jgi:uncharacterized membrane protein YgcG